MSGASQLTDHLLDPGETHNTINTGSTPLDGVFTKHAYLPEDKVDGDGD
jgi:hypothetical protein